MFEHNTAEAIFQEALDAAPADIDIGEHEIYYGASKAPAIKAAHIYGDIEMLLAMMSVNTMTGEFLNARATDNKMTRLPMVKAQYRFYYTGTVPNEGERFFTDNKYFILKLDEENQPYLEADVDWTFAPEEYNGIITGTPAIPVSTIAGLLTAEFGELLLPGADLESDDNLRKRIEDKISGPAENGTKAHYKFWCESVPGGGVGRAKILPLWDGPNTVKGILIGTNMEPALSAIVNSVQEYVDPGGLGLGEGAANLGAYFTAVSATALDVYITVSVSPSAGHNIENIRSELPELIRTYIQGIVKNTPDGEDMVIRYNRVGEIIIGMPDVLDYDDLKINGTTSNLTAADEQVPVLGGVTVDEIV